MSTTELIFNNTKFYPMNENADGSISFNGQTYEIGNKGSDLLSLNKEADATKGKYDFYLDSSTKLWPDSTLTLNDLINKRGKIRLVILGSNNDGAIVLSISQTIDLSKPNSNGHFNFSWADSGSDIATHTYCWFSNGNFLVTSDYLDKYANYRNWWLEIDYSDAS